MNTNLDLRYIFSYLGTLPYLILFIDKTFFNEIQTNIINDFYIFYSLIIIVFIGGVNWSLTEKISKFQVLYGIFPCVFSVIVIILKLYSFSFFNIVLFLVLFIFIQLVLDFYFIYNLTRNKKIFIRLRLPLSFFISFFLIVNLFEF